MAALSILSYLFYGFLIYCALSALVCLVLFDF